MQHSPGLSEEAIAFFFQFLCGAFVPFWIEFYRNGIAITVASCSDE